MGIDLNTMLVALMFITILSMGIGNILGTLAEVFTHSSVHRRSRVHVAWIALILLVHFNLFWHTKSILEVEQWRFGGFLLAILGPVLVFLATSILVTSPSAGTVEKQEGFISSMGRRFFIVFGSVQIWIVAADYAMTKSFVITDLVNLAFLLLAIFLAYAKSAPSQLIGVIIAWGLGLFSLVLRWLN